MNYDAKDRRVRAQAKRRGLRFSSAGRQREGGHGWRLFTGRTKREANARAEQDRRQGD
jgi:hypothetical protein